MSGNTSSERIAALVSSSESEYAKRRRQHMGLINQLRSIGAQADLDLPRIAVIGNQSAGKSSLVEAISGISVPRDAGTCTRCPMECRLMSSTEPWRCQIYIRWEFEPNGKRKDKVHEVPLGSPITKKEDVELALRRAQSAVLNPNTRSAEFLTKSESTLKTLSNECKFSKNTVCVQLSGPELTDLAFVDLPGIIQNEKPDIIQLIEDLVKTSIEGNCLILVTLPMSDDIENQKAARMAQLADPSGLRTIGVMTKPDTIPPGARNMRENWLAVIEGQRHVTKLGYYCTRQPDDDERAKRITSEQARIVENEFFAKTAPWSTSSAKNRFGTENLVSSLSRLLAKIIDDSLPKIQNEVGTQLDYCNKALEELPKAINEDPASYVLTLVTEFCRDVTHYVNGGETHATGLVQADRKTFARYKRAIRSTAPLFMPYPDAGDAQTVANLEEYVRLAGEDDENEDDEENSVSKQQILYLDDVRKHIRLSLARELPNNVPYASKVTLIEAFQASWNEKTKKCFDDVYHAFENILISLVNQRFARYDNLKVYILQTVRELLRVRQVSAWGHVEGILELERCPYTQNGHYLQVTKDKYLALYKGARAEADGSPPAKKSKPMEHSATNGTPGAVSPGVPTSTASAMPKFGTSTGPFTQFTFTPSDQTPGASTPIPRTSSNQPPKNPFAPSLATTADSPPPAAQAGRASRKRGLDDDTRQQCENEALALLAKLGYTGLGPKDLAKLLPLDVYEEELEVIAEVQAYFQVAYKRVIDYVPMMIDKQFLFAFNDAIQGFLIERLGLGTSKGASRCSLYLSEDPAIVAKRDELTRKRERLQRVQTDLDNFDLSFTI